MQLRFCLAAALAVSVAASIWEQSFIAQLSQATNTYGPPVAMGNSSRPVYQLDRSEEDWSGLCSQAIRRDDLWDPLKCVGL